MLLFAIFIQNLTHVQQMSFNAAMEGASRPPGFVTLTMTVGMSQMSLDVVSRKKKLLSKIIITNSTWINTYTGGHERIHNDIAASLQMWFCYQIFVIQIVLDCFPPLKCTLLKEPSPIASDYFQRLSNERSYFSHYPWWILQQKNVPFGTY